MRRLITAGFLLASMTAAMVWSASAHAQVVARWDFNGPAANAVPGGSLSPSPSVGQGVASLVGGVTADVNFGSGASNGGSSDPAGGAPPNYGWQTTTYAAQSTGSGTRGVQFAVSSEGFAGIGVTWDQRHSNTSSRFAQFQYSIDGVNFTSDGLPNSGIFEAHLGGDRWYNARHVDLTPIPGVADNPDFAFRIVAVFDPTQAPGEDLYTPSTLTSSYAASGTWRFDYVTVHSMYEPVPHWPEVFNPYRLVRLNLDMDPKDWLTVQQDESLSVYVPALFWADGEAPMLVGVRRKSATPLNQVPEFSKVSLKVDINIYVAGQSWHGLRKLSLENGDDENVVSEGLAWRYHHLASGPEGYGYAHSAAMASWITLKINDVQTGIYLSVEQRDRRFLQNRGLWTPEETWLYEVDDVSNPQGGVIEAGPDSGVHSPLVMELCHLPFRNPGGCPQPPAATLVEVLPQKIKMRAMMTLAGVSAFTVGPDQMLPKGKNFRFVDFADGLRLYYPWDLDTTILNTNASIYPTGSNPIYANMLLGIPQFRAQYSAILRDLICGPLKPQNLLDFLDAVEPVISEALEADPNRNFSGSTAEHFSSLRNWVNLRTTRVIQQLEGWTPCPLPQHPGDVNGDGVVNVADLLAVISAWGACPAPPAPCPADVAPPGGDGSINVADLLMVIGNWG